MIHEHDLVRTVQSLPESGLPANAIGTIVHVFPSDNLYEVEFAATDDSGDPIIATLPANQIAPTTVQTAIAFYQPIDVEQIEVDYNADSDTLFSRFNNGPEIVLSGGNGAWYHVDPETGAIRAITIPRFLAAFVAARPALRDSMVSAWRTGIGQMVPRPLLDALVA